MKLNAIRKISLLLIIALLFSLVSCINADTPDDSDGRKDEISSQSGEDSEAQDADSNLQSDQNEADSATDSTQEPPYSSENESNANSSQTEKPNNASDEPSDIATEGTPSDIATEGTPSDIVTESEVIDSDDTDGDIEESATNEAIDDATETSQPPQNQTIPVFSNGSYKISFIRSDVSNELDKNVYNRIRTLFKEKTGKLPSFASDFVSVGSEPYDGPAVLVGSTNYEASKSENLKLKDGEASARICDGKYVISFSNTVAASKLVNALAALINKQSATDITIDQSWEITISETADVEQTFDDSGLISSATLPKYDGEFLTGSYDAGQGTKLYVKKDATAKKFNDFCTALFGAGFRYYTDNKIGDNLFATYVTQTQIVHVMYFAELGEIRITVDIRGVGEGGFDLPALAGENEYEKTAEPSMTMVEVDNTGYPGGMCFIFRLSNGKFFIIDSGIGGVSSYSSATWLYKTLKEIAGTDKIVVAGWLITHIHSDHLGGLVDIARGYCCKKSDGSKTALNIKDKITIEQLIHNDTTSAIAEARDCADRVTWMSEVIKAFNVKSVIKAHPGQVLHFADAKVTVLASQDVNLDVVDTIDNVNEFSVATRVEFNGKSILFPGDAEVNQNAFMATVYNTHLKSDFLQVTHHGYNLTGAQKLNEYCNPEIALWTIGYDAKNERDKFEMNLNWAMNAYLKENKINYSAMDGNLTFDKSWNKSDPWAV